MAWDVPHVDLSESQSERLLSLKASHGRNLDRVLATLLSSE